jgi:hypothetical protein
MIPRSLNRKGVKMRSFLAVTVATFLVGCHWTQSPRGEAAKISEALVRSITPEEARQMLRNSRSSDLDAFLKRLREGDELWYYRTYVWENRGGEDGFAILRNGRVVEQMPFLTFD